MARCNVALALEHNQTDAIAAPHVSPDQLVRELLEQAVSRVFMVAGADLWSGTRGRPRVAFARQVAMYLAHVAWGLTMTEVGHVFARDRTTVAHACGLVEDLRDDPVLDRSLELLEGVLRAFSPASPVSVQALSGVLMSAADGAAAAISPAIEKDGLRGAAAARRQGRLCRPGGSRPGTGGDFAVFSPRNGFARAARHHPGRGIRLGARRAAGSRPSSGTGRYRIAAAGIKALRRAKSGPACVHAGSRPTSGGCEESRRARPQPRRWRKGGIAGLAAPPQGQGRPASHHGAAVRRRRAPGRGLLACAAQPARHRRLVRHRIEPAHAAARRPEPASRSAITWWRRASAWTGADAVGPELAGILIDVCCHDVGLETAGRTGRRRPQRAGAARIVRQPRCLASCAADSTR